MATCRLNLDTLQFSPINNNDNNDINDKNDKNDNNNNNDKIIIKLKIK